MWKWSLLAINTNWTKLIKRKLCFFIPFLLSLISISQFQQQNRMSSNNLLLSLLANSSANPRSSSLMLKNALAQSNPRSSSTVRPKPKQDSQHSASLVRLAHLLNLKVRNHYYFIFCKLEQINKKCRSQNAKQEIVDVESQQNRNGLKEEQCKKGIVALCDSYSTFASKRESMRERELLIHGFACLVETASKAKGVQKIALTIEQHISKEYHNVFGLFHLLEKQKMRNQIIQINFSQLVTSRLLESFEVIKAFAKTRVLILQEQYSSSSRCEEQCSSTGEKSSRAKKIILREKRMAPSAPVTLFNIHSKIPGGCDWSLQTDSPFDNDFKMVRIMNTKQDMLVTSAPDLTDNFQLFGVFENYCLTSATTLTQDCSFTFTEMKESQGCLTDRSREAKPDPPQSRSLKNTPKYGKETSVSKKEVHLQVQQSPLAKIDEILSKIQQMKHLRSERSGDKRMVNVNLSRQAWRPEHQNTIKYHRKTPNKQFQEAQKENYPQRLVTEREAGSRKKGTLDSTKYKSTVLSKTREREAPLSTARKMKMQIQNIINRRNKQLYRAESVQLN